MIDLHCHSQESDGELTPAGLVALAAERGLTALALTDHDTVSGLDAFLAAGRDGPMTTVPGVEIACQGEGHAILHIVGLWVESRDPGLARLLAGIRVAREERNQAILERLTALGCPLSFAEVAGQTRGKVIGRPHFAQALIRRGYCRNHREAFDRFLARGKPACVPRRLPPVEEALPVLSAAGAVCIWAHPLTSHQVTGAYLRRVVTALRPLGLDGIEVYYSDYTPGDTRLASAQAEALGLLQSGGSDFHGANIPGIDLGIGRGNLNLPDSLLAPLAARAREKRATYRLAHGAEAHTDGGVQG